MEPDVPKKCPWIAWGRPDVNLARVYACGVYVLPSGMAPASRWQDKCGRLMAECKEFHEKQFPGSRLEWALHGPLYLTFNAAKHRGNPNGFYDAMRDAVLEAARAGKLPNLASGANAGSLTTDEASVYVPTICDFVCLADWGERAVPGPPALDPYYIGMYATKVRERFVQMVEGGVTEGLPELIDLSDITMTGGSRSTFMGKVPRLSIRGILPFTSRADKAVAAAAAARSAATVPAAPQPQPTPVAPRPDGSPSGAGSSDCAPAPTVLPQPAPVAAASATRRAAAELTFWASSVAIGVGLVTQEAWYHPEVPGSASVTYHEGLGHALNMPHPSRRREPLCVMDLGQYAGLHLPLLHICEEIKEDMVAPELRPDGSIVSSRLSCVLAREDLARGGPHFRETVARRLLAANATAAATSGRRKDGSAMWVAWQATDQGGRPFEASVIHRKVPLALAAGAATGVAAGAGEGDVAVAGEDEDEIMMQRAIAASLSAPGPSDDDGASTGSSGSGSGSTASTSSSQRSEAVEAALAAGEGERGVSIHGHAKGEPYELGAEWTETQMVACAVGPGSQEGALPGVLPGEGPVGLFRVVEYHFREVVWSAPPATAAVTSQLARHLESSSTPAPEAVVVIFDKGRNIAIALGREQAYLSSAGLHGVWGPFAQGGWIGEKA